MFSFGVVSFLEIRGRVMVRDEADNLPEAFFVGSICLDVEGAGHAYSEAGDSVQREIVSSLRTSGQFNGVRVLSIEPRVSFLSGGSIYKPAAILADISAPGFINLQVLKHLWVAVYLFVDLLRYRPRYVFCYNANFFFTLVMFLYRFVGRGVRLCGIVQDVLPLQGVKTLMRFLDLVALRMWSRFDFLAPVSETIISDFGLRAPYMVLEGGVLERNRRCFEGFPMESTRRDCGDVPYFVFAGALEAYNGIDRLVERWKIIQDRVELHVYGSGSLEPFLQKAMSEDRRIKFLGRARHDVIMAALAGSAGAFCLRYSAGINSNYFFPSKFFELLCVPRPLLVNRFSGLRREHEFGCLILDDDLSDLGETLRASIEEDSNVKAQERCNRAVRKFSYCAQVHQLVSGFLGKLNNVR